MQNARLRGRFRAPGPAGGTVTRAPLPHRGPCERSRPAGPGSRLTQSRGSARGAGGRAGRRRRPREPPSPAQPVRQGHPRGHRIPDSTWLQVMNSLVWVSSTSVHSLLRKAGTLELCFIVSQAQGFRILLPNAEVASVAASVAVAVAVAVAAAAARQRRRQQLLPEKAHRAGAAARGPRPPRRRGACSEAGETPRPHVTDRGSRLHPCARLPRRASASPIQTLGRTTEQSDWLLPRGGVGAGGVLPSLLPFRQASL